MKKVYVFILVILSFTVTNVHAQIAAWDFTSAAAPATFAATTFNANLVATAGANNITRGPGAAASAGANSFRTVQFSNNGIATTNTDYFQITLTATTGNVLSLSTIDARFAGTATYAAGAGVSNQFAYSLDGTNFTLIGTPFVNIGTPATLTQINLSGIAALQNVPAGTTVTLRYYASGQTTTGGWGFNSPAPGQNGLAIGGTVAAAGPTATINVTPNSLSGFLSTAGVPTAEQTYSVDGNNLTADITITPPVGYEIATVTGGPYTVNPASITLTQTAGVVNPTTIYVRMNSATLGVNAGNITNTSAGSNDPNVAVTGNVISAEPTTQGVISFGTITNTTMDVNFTSGDGAKRILVIHAGVPVNADPVDGTTYTASATYGAGTQIGTGNYVVYAGTGNAVTVTGLNVATTYYYALYEFNDNNVAGAENYLLPAATANATTLNIVNTYLWTGAISNVWTDPLNWLPTRLTPAANDSLLFVGPLNVTVTGVPAETIGYLGVSLGANVTLQALATTTTLNIGGSSGVDLEVEAGSQLNINTANAYTINILTGSTAVINGDMTFSAGAHKFTAADASGITFANGSTFNAAVGLTGNPFGSGTANSVVFASGSIMNQAAGSNPFSLGQPASVVVFQTGSLFRALANFALSLSGRTYANVEINSSLFAQSQTGAAALTIDTLTITQGTWNLNVTGGINIKGNVNVAAGQTLGFNAASLNTLTFNGTVPQSITNNGTLNFGLLENLTINNAAGVTLNSSITLGPTATLALTSGILKLTPTATTVTLSSGTALTGGNSNASYVDGKVKKIGNTDFTFPVGKTNFGYVPIKVSNFVGGTATDAFTAEYRRGNARLLGPVTAPFIDHVSGCDYWTLDLNSGTPQVDVTAYWSPNNPCNGTYIDDLATLELVHFDGANWNSSSFGMSATNGNTVTGDITWTNVTTFSPFALGGRTTANPLPININYFTGAKQNGVHAFNWLITCNSTPTVTMQLERSTDGRNYSSIYTRTATAVECQQPFLYNDASPAAGVNYYRIKTTDISGKVTYSQVVSLINAIKGIDILNIAPNPVTAGKFDLKISSAQNASVQLMITDMQGRVLMQQTVNAAAGFNVVPVNVSRLAAGTYQLSALSDGEKTRVLRFVVQ